MADVDEVALALVRHGRDLTHSGPSRAVRSSSTHSPQRRRAPYQRVQVVVPHRSHPSASTMRLTATSALWAMGRASTAVNRRRAATPATTSYSAEARTNVMQDHSRDGRGLVQGRASEHRGRPRSIRSSEPRCRTRYSDGRGRRYHRTPVGIDPRRARRVTTGRSLGRRDDVHHADHLRWATRNARLRGGASGSRPGSSETGRSRFRVSRDNDGLKAQSV